MTSIGHIDHSFEERLQPEMRVARSPACSGIESGLSIAGHSERKSYEMTQNHGVPMIYPSRARWTSTNQRSDEPFAYVAEGEGS